MSTRTVGRRFGIATVVVGIAAGATVASAPATAPEARLAQACVPSTKLEAIIDDSGSMASSDVGELRRRGVEVFIETPGNAGRTLGAVEFGSNADTVFAPLPIAASSRDTMFDALAAKIAADGARGVTGVDDGFATDYNDGFARGALDHPGATARIFLTDGAHNENVYANGHLPGPRTYVIGLGVGPASAENPDGTRLQQIADDTGGRYFPNVVQAAVQATFTTISALVSCNPEPVNVPVPLFASIGQTASRTFEPATRARSVGFVLNWAGSGNRFAFSDVRALGRRGRVVATESGRGRPRKLRIRSEQGETFQSLTIRRFRAMRELRFTITATRLLEGEAPIVQARSILR